MLIKRVLRLDLVVINNGNFDLIGQNGSTQTVHLSVRESRLRNFALHVLRAHKAILDWLQPEGDILVLLFKYIALTIATFRILPLLVYQVQLFKIGLVRANLGPESLQVLAEKLDLTPEFNRLWVSELRLLEEQFFQSRHARLLRLARLLFRFLRAGRTEHRLVHLHGGAHVVLINAVLVVWPDVDVLAAQLHHVGTVELEVGELGLEATKCILLHIEHKRARVGAAKHDEEA